jgi:hypothetical protein
MKKNGYLLFGLVSLWLISITPALSQDFHQKDIQNQKVVIPSQIDKNPVDLINRHTIHTGISRNAFKSPSGLVEYQPDSIIYYSGMSLNCRETFIYDLNGNLTEYLKETRGISGWLNSELINFTYDDYGHVLTELKQSWIGFFWEKTYLLTYTYDSWGNMLTYLLQNWEFGHWNNYNYYMYTYDSSGKLLTCQEQFWSSEEWVNSSLSSNYYDQSENLIRSTREIWNNGDWINSDQNLNTFNDNMCLTSSLFEYWNGEEWFDYELHLYEYNDIKKLSTHLVQFYTGDLWINNLLYSYTYDQNGYDLTYCLQFWGENEWLSNTLITTVYDENGRKLSELIQEWLDTWNNITNSTYTYDEIGNCLTKTLFNWNNDFWENYTMTEYEYTEGLISGTGYSWDGSSWINGDVMLEMKLKNNDGDEKFFCEWWGSKVEVYYTALYTSAPEMPNETNPAFSVYPNPAGQNLSIEYNNGDTGVTMLKIIDLSGKVIETMSLENSSQGLRSVKLNTGDLLSGTYIFEMNSGQQSSIQKVSIVK